MDKVKIVRQVMAERKLAAYVQPVHDEYMSEYPPACNRRVEWLTGFSGSAGTAVVLAKRAALFTDGRYTLQAAQETDSEQFDILHSGETSPSAWVAEALPPGARLGYDPWLHVADQVAAFNTACERAGGTLVSVDDDNPLDEVWLDQPTPPLAPVLGHPLVFAGRSADDKRADMAKDLSDDRVAAAVLTDPSSIAWLLNIRGGDIPFVPLPLSFAIIHADGRVDLFMNAAKLGGMDLGEAVRVRPPSELGAALAALGRDHARVRIDASQAPHAIAERLRKSGAKVDAGQDPCALPRACKNAVELDGARAAHRRDGAALVNFLAWLSREAPRSAITEIEAARVLEQYRRHGQHYQEPSFPTIAGAGSNGAIIHYHATETSNRRLEGGQLFLLDSGGQYLDGTTDVTRTLGIGKVGAEEQHRYTLVLKGHIALAQAIFPTGTTGSQLDMLARSFLWAEGLDYDHGTGHGVGSYLSVHEGPQRISKQGNATALRPGMILSDEPGYYKPGAYGIRLENLVAVIPAPGGMERDLLRFEVLTLVPFDRTLIKLSLLNEAEIDWLDAYHARIAAEIGPLVNAESWDWLKVATAPLRGDGV